MIKSKILDEIREESPVLEEGVHLVRRLTKQGFRQSSSPEFYFLFSAMSFAMFWGTTSYFPNSMVKVASTT